MKSLTPTNGTPEANSEVDKEAVLRELESILSSPFFRTSNRSKQFLTYVVQHTLEGSHEPLKERTIGAKLFQRPAGYSTGDDPVVRVQAGEVRRRLEQYHHASLNQSPVRIELPVGSYAPAFHWAATEPGLHDSASVEAIPEPVLPTPLPKREQVLPTRRRWPRVVSLAGLGVALVAILVTAVVHRSGSGRSAMHQFWSPVLGTSEPVLICLAKPRVYRPSAEIYEKYARTPGEFNAEWKRLTQEPPLDPKSQLTWGDMVEYTDFGVAAGDVYAALRMSAALSKLGEESQVRIGDNYSFSDLRNSPAIVVGAFNNRWTMQMTSNLHFAFTEENGRQMIREQGPSGRSWSARFGAHREVIEDYGIVTRLLNSKTGNFVVATAGLLSAGTQAAAELVSSPVHLEEALKAAPPDWAKRNLQFVVQTTVTDEVPGPPQVIAVYIW